VASLSQGRTAAAQCGLFTHKSVPVIFEPPCIFEMKCSLAQLQESLDLNSLGKLSTTLINPYNLSTILQQVSQQLPDGMSMLTGFVLLIEHAPLPLVILHAMFT